MMAIQNGQVTLTAQCLCKSHTFSAPVPESSLPLEGSICHCTSCRRVTGAMYANAINWPGSSDEVLSSDLTRYGFTSNASLLFCGRCSSPVFWDQHYNDGPQNICVFAGVLNNVPVKSLIKVLNQIFVGDTEDGGFSQWLQLVNRDGEKPRRWKGRAYESEELDNDWPMNNPSSSTKDPHTNAISIRCHCKGIEFVFRPGNTDFSAMDAGSLPSYIDPKTHKHLATHDACNSCRLSVGVEIMNWTSALLQQIDFPSKSGGSHFPRSTFELKAAVQSSIIDPRYGTLAMYSSSPNVQRYFCSRCSASVFYTVDDCPEQIDVALGLLDSTEGSRIESILTWDLGAKMIGEQDLVGGWREDFVQSVKEASEQWRIQKGYPKTWERISSEGA
ncbi:hypothetical protein F66182_4409 [Fusarium sp. NRRL 66182]|nr:hypothetical protein F66182_4409 [Fusarium sp. NRRL 66182]